tara:strand:- start:43 stop:663 length:621 start_codon:yes stop_codon:yes gene_type:complete
MKYNNNETKELQQFITPIWYSNQPELLYLDSNCDKYIDESIAKHGRKFGISNHSDSLTEDKNFKPLTDLVGKMSIDFLDKQGFNMKKYTCMFTELWVQEFPKEGGGHHEPHCHYNQHVSGFYFLKCSDKTSTPVFYDPRPGAIMTKLEEKDSNKLTSGVPHINYHPRPGDLVLFNSYLPHGFRVDSGEENFRFIHFNLQAFPNQLF